MGRLAAAFLQGRARLVRPLPSATDFAHKLKICLKELRESYRWLLLFQYVPLLRARLADSPVKETDEPICILVRSIQTVQQRKRDASRFKVPWLALDVGSSPFAGRGGHPRGVGLGGTQRCFHHANLHA